jgi:pentatricopeptide repeat protein
VASDLVVQHGWPEDSRIYAMLLNFWSRRGDQKQLKQILRIMKWGKIPFEPHHCSALLTGLAHAHSPKGALVLYKHCVASVKDPKRQPAGPLLPDIKGWAEFLTQCVYKNDTKLAMSLLEQLTQSKSISPDVIIYTSLMKAFVTTKQPHLAITTFKQLIQYNLTPSIHTFTILIQAHIDSGDMPSALCCFKEMQKQKYEINLQMYELLLVGFSNMGKADECWQLVYEMDRLKLAHSCRALRTLLSLACNTKDTKRILLVMERIRESRNKDLKDHAATLLIRFYMRLGDCSQAQQTFHHLTEQWQLQPSASMYQALLLGYLRAGNMKLAIRVLAEMHVNKVKLSALLLNTFLRGWLIHTRQLKEADRVMSLMYKNRLPVYEWNLQLYQSIKSKKSI